MEILYEVAFYVGSTLLLTAILFVLSTAFAIVIMSFIFNLDRGVLPIDINDIRVVINMYRQEEHKMVKVFKYIYYLYNTGILIGVVLWSVLTLEIFKKSFWKGSLR